MLKLATLEKESREVCSTQIYGTIPTWYILQAMVHSFYVLSILLPLFMIQYPITGKVSSFNLPTKTYVNCCGDTYCMKWMTMLKSFFISQFISVKQSLQDRLELTSVQERMYLLTCNKWKPYLYCHLSHVSSTPHALF